MAVLQQPKQELTYLGASTPPGASRPPGVPSKTDNNQPMGKKNRNYKSTAC